MNVHNIKTIAIVFSRDRRFLSLLLGNLYYRLNIFGKSKFLNNVVKNKMLFKECVGCKKKTTIITSQVISNTSFSFDITYLHLSLPQFVIELEKCSTNMTLMYYEYKKLTIVLLESVTSCLHKIVSAQSQPNRPPCIYIEHV